MTGLSSTFLDCRTVVNRTLPRAFSNLFQMPKHRQPHRKPRFRCQSPVETCWNIKTLVTALVERQGLPGSMSASFAGISESPLGMLLVARRDMGYYGIIWDFNGRVKCVAENCWSATLLGSRRPLSTKFLAIACMFRWASPQCRHGVLLCWWVP